MFFFKRLSFTKLSTKFKNLGAFVVLSSKDRGYHESEALQLVSEGSHAEDFCIIPPKPIPHPRIIIS